jgi:hypothetical protein
MARGRPHLFANAGLSYSVSSALTWDEETGELVCGAVTERYGRRSPAEIVTDLTWLQHQSIAPKSHEAMNCRPSKP